MRAHSKYKFPGKFRIRIAGTEQYGITPFVAGYHEFETDRQLERHLNMLAKKFEAKQMKNCKIMVKQV